MASTLSILLVTFSILLPVLPLTTGHALPPGVRANSGGPSSTSNATNHNSSSSNSTSLAALLKTLQLSFPPPHCTEDLDCIGRNASSRIFYDPYGRCDQSQKTCSCKVGYKHLPLRVKTTRGRRSSASSTSNLNTSAPIYITKCVPEGPTELDSFLRASLHYYGKTCLEDKECESNLICRQLNPSAARSRNLIPAPQLPPAADQNATTTSKNQNLQSLWANKTKRCRCPNGQHWNKHSRRCEWPHSVYGVGQVIDPSSGTGSPTSHSISQTNIDLKLFEIVLEIAFLIACLLGYKACSTVCCKDDTSETTTSGSYSTETYATTTTGSGGTKTDGSTSPGSDVPSSTCDANAEVKSDEEFIISRRSSTPGMKGKKAPPLGVKPLGASGGSLKYKKTTATNSRVARKRRSVGRFCRRDRRSTSPYSQTPSLLFSSSTSNFRRLSSVSASMSRSSSASTRNLLVKINPDDAKRALSVSTTLAPPGRPASPCYNCRIYKEVYSPSARCKSCRASLLSVIDQVDPSALDLGRKSGASSKNSSLLEFDTLLVLDGAGSVVSGGSSLEGGKKGAGSLLPLPPYKQKPIRRSEEVGVPPHLRAPYRDTQPFWLK